jgi:hypothetical protein
MQRVPVRFINITNLDDGNEDNRAENAIGVTIVSPAHRYALYRRAASA